MDFDDSSVHSNGDGEDSIATQIERGELHLKEKSGRSKVWNVFSILVDGDGQEIQYVSCNICKKILKYSSSTSNLVRHKCFITHQQQENSFSSLELDEASKKFITTVITRWIVKNCRPYNIVADSGLHEVLQHFVLIGFKHGCYVDIQKCLPQPTTLSTNVGNLYRQCFQSVREEIYHIKDNGFSITSDLWTDDYSKKSYIAVNIHFLKDGILKTKVLGVESMAGERCTGDNIFKRVQNVICNFGCQLTDNTIIVTNGNFVMKKAFENHQNIACISHLLNKVLQKSIEEATEVKELTNRCVNLVEYLKKSGLDANLSTSLDSFRQTRWISIYYMLRSIEMNWGEIIQILQNENEIDKIDFIKKPSLKALTDFLQQFDEAFRTFEAESNATMHLVLVYLHQLKMACNPENEDLDIILKFKQKILLHLDSIAYSNISIFHKIALFLFPPTNKLLQFSEKEKQFVEDECSIILERFHNEEPNGQDDIEVKPPACKQMKLFSAFIEQSTQQNSSNAVRRELDKYTNTRVSYEVDFNVFSWWDLHQNSFPLLYKLSRIIFATPASITDSERVFSVARYLISEKRTELSLNEKDISQLIFTHLNIDNVVFESN